MKPMGGAVPLSAIEAVAVDTETTGLDTAVARIVQIAAVPICPGNVSPPEPFETLVNPGEAIPAASTAIHGIVDAAVASSPRIGEVLPHFLAYCAGRILIGHSIGFDLAVLENEARRAGLAWQKPRSLCLRFLGAIANPRLPEGSLDALAHWLGITIEGRHRAMGDARAAADVFAALVPHLATQGIRTLAEAERACLGLTEHLERGHRAGWVEPVSRPDLSSTTGAVDPYAYRHRVLELMNRDPVIVGENTTIQAAVALMAERQISSVLVSTGSSPGEQLDRYGILTERDVMRQIAAHGADVLTVPVGEIASRPLASIAGAAFVYRAIARMDRLNIRHLAVRDERERLAGIISARDLLKLRAGAAIKLDDAIGAAESAAEMAQAWATLPAVARRLVGEGLDARLIAGVVSEEIRVMTRRAAELAEVTMLRDRFGPPPSRYALMVLGSGGRGESLLAPDQDNAIVFAEGEPGSSQDRWFAELGRRIADTLDASGIPYCKGGIMAREPAWRGSLSHWKQRIDEWVLRSRAEDLLNVDIFFDQRPVHGDLELGAALFDHSYAAAADRPPFAKLIGEKLFARPSPFTFLGAIQTVEGRIDLKLHGLFPIVTATRALAIRHDIRKRSTKGRLEKIARRGLGNADELGRLAEAHSVFMSLMLEQQSIDLEAGIPVSNRVDLAALSRARHTELKSALKVAATVPDLVRDLMFA